MTICEKAITIEIYGLLMNGQTINSMIHVDDALLSVKSSDQFPNLLIHVNESYLEARL